MVLCGWAVAALWFCTSVASACLDFDAGVGYA